MGVDVGGGGGGGGDRIGGWWGRVDEIADRVKDDCVLHHHDRCGRLARRTPSLVRKEADDGKWEHNIAVLLELTK